MRLIHVRLFSVGVCPGNNIEITHVACLLVINPSLITFQLTSVLLKVALLNRVGRFSAALWLLRYNAVHSLHPCSIACEIPPQDGAGASVKAVAVSLLNCTRTFKNE